MIKIQGALNSHVAWLAEADQVIQSVRVRSAREEPIGLDVVDRDRISDSLAAFLACAIIPTYRSGSRSEPSFAAIGRNAADVISGPGARLHPCLVGAVAGFCAESPARLARILSFKPRLNFKARATVRASVNVTQNGIESFGLLAREGVSGGKAATPFISVFVGVRHLPLAHVPLSRATTAAKSSGVSAIQSHAENGAANLAVLLNCHHRTMAEHGPPVNGNSMPAGARA